MKKILFSKNTETMYRMITYIFILSTAFLFIKCSTEPEEDYCGMLSTSDARSAPALHLTCEGTLNSTRSNVTYGEYHRIASCTVSVSCSGKNYTGYFNHIVYNSLGEIQSYDATVNGQSCHYSR
jgi:hypothetical protein